MLGRDAGRLEQESALETLIGALVAAGKPLRRGSPPPVHSDRIASAKAYIDEHYADAFGVSELAGLTGLSVFHFSRSFKKVVGLSPLAYRNQRRVAEARARLLDGEPIAQVALMMGYADQSHLTRHFQRIVGASATSKGICVVRVLWIVVKRPISGSSPITSGRSATEFQHAEEHHAG